MSDRVQPPDLEWLIIGGGIHGVHIAARLIGDAGISPELLRIVDPGKQLLERWKSCTATTGMSHLRSPSVHHLDLDPWSLQQFVGKRRKRKTGLLAGKYQRPALSLFNAHCQRVIDVYGLDKLHIQDRALQIRVECDRVMVELANETHLTARNLVLAIGAGDQPRWPEWAPRNHDRVQHIFDPDFDSWPKPSETVAVVGGGISSAQVSLRLFEEGRRVHMISRHAPREHKFDSDPGWLGPRHMLRFSHEKDFDQRRLILNDARYPGSMPAGVLRALRRAAVDDRFQWLEDGVKEVEEVENLLRLTLTSGASIEVDRVLLATGFSPQRPGGSMVDGLVESASLPCAECGYPVVDAGLRWHANVYVTGPLAELELGPVSRNIAGARRAADRLVHAVMKGRRPATKSA